MSSIQPQMPFFGETVAVPSLPPSFAPGPSRGNNFQVEPHFSRNYNSPFPIVNTVADNVGVQPLPVSVFRDSF